MPVIMTTSDTPHPLLFNTRFFFYLNQLIPIVNVYDFLYDQYKYHHGLIHPMIMASNFKNFKSLTLNFARPF